MKKLNLSAIRIDGGTHHNYVALFADGSCKVGVTARPRVRLVELQRARASRVVRVMLTPASERRLAYGLERDLCRLTKFAGIPGTREWRRAGEFDYLRQTTGMFWHLRMSAPYAPVETTL